MSNVEAIKKALEGVTPEKIFVHFIENPDVMLELFSPYRIRKWNVTPFEGGVEYVPASTLEALQRENGELKTKIIGIETELVLSKPVYSRRQIEARVKALEEALERAAAILDGELGQSWGERNEADFYIITTALASAGEHHAE